MIKCKMNRIITVFAAFLAILLFLVCANTGYAAGESVTISTAFPDGAFRQYVSDNFDTDKDGRLSAAEISAVTFMDIPKMGICSLEGIGVFTELQILRCKSNALLTLDLSNNRKLTELEFTSCQLNELDLSKNTALKKVILYFNKLTEVDVSKNTALEYLDCYGNQLQKLDVTNNRSLTRLSCGYNYSLKELNVKSNPLLEDLECSCTMISSLDLSSNPKLKYLTCEETKLTTLDLTHNPDLQLLDCRLNSSIKNLDLSKNAALRDSDLYTDELDFLLIPQNSPLGSKLQKTRRIWVKSGQAALCLSPHGGTVSKESIILTGGSSATIPEATRTGYYLLGWNEDPASTTVQYTPGKTVTLSKSLFLSAIWKKGITKHPDNGYFAVGETCRFSVQAIGEGTLSYQWQAKAPGSDTWKNSSAASAKTANFSFTMTQTHVGYQFRCVVTDGKGRQTISKECTVTLPAAVIADAFPNSIFRAYVLANFDTDGDGKFNEEELAAVTYVDVSGMGIQSIKGIELFPNLRYLYCSDNKLAGLNLTKNTALERLFCERNLLPSLNVSKNVNLQSLGCDHNKLAGLDLSKNTKLTYISCYDTAVELDTVSLASAQYDTYLNGDAETIATGVVSRTVNGRTLILNCDTDVIAAIAPKITAQPKNVTKTIGDTASFSVTATGIGELSYQWQIKGPSATTWSNSGSASAKTSTFSFTIASGHNGYQVRCVVTSASGLTSTSSSATLTALKPGIQTQPKSTTIFRDETVKLSVTANGVGKLSYQWQVKTPSSDTWKNSSAASAKTANFSFTAQTGHNGCQFRCIVTDAKGTQMTSQTATVTVKQPGITTQPKSVSVAVGTTTSFSVTAQGVGTLKYQWQAYNPKTKTWVNSSGTGARAAKLSVTAQSAHNGFKFRCIVTDGNGNQYTSSNATLTLKLSVTSQPTGKTVSVGSTAKFVYGVTGASPLTYQWQVYNTSTRKWVNSAAASAKTSTFSFTAQKGHNGKKFRCVVTDGNGNTVTSVTVTLTVK